jgi:hypothetical protein
MSEPSDQSGSFHDFIELCKQIEAEGSYNGKTKLVAEFLKSHNVDLYLFCKLMLCKDDKRVYNMKEKQIVKALSRIWQCPLQEMISDLDNGDFSETAKKVCDSCFKIQLLGILSLLTYNSSLNGYQFFEKYGQPQKQSTLTLKQVDDWLQVPLIQALKNQNSETFF